MGKTIIGDNSANNLVRDPNTLVPYDNTYTIIGLGGNDDLNGGIMKGGAGDDRYYVDSLSDIVNEEGNLDPYDTVYSYIESIDLSTSNNYGGIEILELIGPEDGWAELGAGSAKNGKGNSLDNTIYGNSLANTLKGEGGHDELYGNGGNDIIEGGTGNDKLHGFGGSGSSAGKGEIDKLTGGAGTDEFVLWAYSSNSKVAAYNDGLLGQFVNGHWKPSSGTSDFAHITDFNKFEDRIELAGPASNYVLADLSNSMSSSLGISGTGIFLEQGFFGRELIGVIENVSANQLSLNSPAFEFV